MDGELVPPGLRSRLRGLRIGSRRAVAGGGFGLHRSQSRGAGMEFAQYRGYEPGDDPRRIDWKLYARSDRCYVREAERESPLSVWLLLDTSASMGQADLARPEWSRLDAARVLAAAVADVALAQGDRCGLLVLDAATAPLPPAAGTRQRDRIALALRRAVPAGVFPGPASLLPLLSPIAPGDVVLLISDLFDEACVEMAVRLAAAGREVLAIRLLTADERDFPYRDGRRFVDPETGASLLGDGPALRRGFLERFGQARRELSARLGAAGIRHVEYVLDEPLEQPLRALFGRGPAQ